MKHADFKMTNIEFATQNTLSRTPNAKFLRSLLPPLKTESQVVFQRISTH